jgi:thiol:disulfide interchange protein
MLKKIKVIPAVMLAVLALAGFSGAAFAQARKPPQSHVHIRLVPEHSHIGSGETVTVAIDQTIDKGWHTYWINPGDSGEPPDIKWTLPAGFKTGDIQWPVPEKIITSGLGSYGYLAHATLLQDITAPKNIPAGALTLTAVIDILVCREVCIPETGTYSFMLNASIADKHSTLADAARGRLPVSLPEGATFQEDNGDFVVGIALPKDADAAAPVSLMPQDWGIVDNPSKATVDFKNNTVRQKRGDRPIDKLAKIHVLVAYKDVKGAEQAVIAEAHPAKAIRAAAAAPAKTEAAPAKTDKAPAATIEKLTLANAILFALLGGLILNLMPCVFPILSLKTLKLCKLSGGELKEARLHSLLYTAGILASFGVLAVSLIVLRGAGQQIGWGFQLQNPAFVLPLSWLLFVIGLNLSGFFEFGGGLANLGSKLTQGHSLAASFFTGVLAAIVATPCTAPFMATALGYALTQPAPVTLAVLLALGFGLALPFLLISFIPALRNTLPKPGIWMATFKEFLAFPMFGSAAWLAWVFSLQAGPLGVLTALAGAVAITFGLWLLKNQPKVLSMATLVVRALAAVSFIAAAALIPAAGKMEKQASVAMAMDDWTPYVAADFDKLEKGSDPLFVDMTAAWCITCKVNENAVLNTMAIKELFHKHKVRTVKGDWTNQNPEITQFLARYGRNGVPIYVFYGARDKSTGARPAPVVLPQLLTPGIVERTVEGK